MGKKRVHYLRVRVTFDRACTLTVAARSVKDAIEGYDYFALPQADGDPEEFKLARITRPAGRAALASEQKR